MSVIMTIVLLFGSVILVHEFGHFMMARLTGMRVERFSIGFPPRLFSLKPTERGWVFRVFFFKKTTKGLEWQPIIQIPLSKKHPKSPTQYNFALIPLGGYVKVAGVVDESMDTAILGKQDEFSSKNSLQKIVFLAGGVLMNFVLAILIFTAMGKMYGIPAGGTTINVFPNSPADRAGLVSGDSLLSIGNFEVENWQDIVEKIQAKADTSFDIRFARAGEIYTIHTYADDYIVEYQDTTITSHGIGIRSNPGSFIGIIFFRQFTPIMRDDTLKTALKYSFSEMKTVFQILSGFIHGLFVGDISIKENLGGPISIVNEAHSAYQSGWLFFLYFIAFISIQIGLLNILPIPGLDGGHILVVLVESILRRPLSMPIRIRIQQIGLFLLLSLMIFVTFNDILRLL